MEPWTTIALPIFVLIGLALSWAATVIPIFPAPTVMWGLTLLYGILTGFTTRAIIIFVIITLLTVVSWVTDNLLSIAGARKGGARWASVIIASVVGLVTSIFFTPIVGIVATFGALYLAENYYQRDAALAWESTKQMLIGWGWSTVVRLAIGLVIIILWVIWAWA